MDSINHLPSNARAIDSAFAHQSTPFREFLAGKSRVCSHALIVCAQATLENLVATTNPAAPDALAQETCLGKPGKKKARSEAEAGEIAFTSTTPMGGHRHA